MHPRPGREREAVLRTPSQLHGKQSAPTCNQFRPSSYITSSNPPRPVVNKRGFDQQIFGMMDQRLATVDQLYPCGLHVLALDQLLRTSISLFQEVGASPLPLCVRESQAKAQLKCRRRVRKSGDGNVQIGSRWGDNRGFQSCFGNR